MMHVALIGATGFLGGAVLNELLDRDHTVTVVLRPSSTRGCTGAHYIQQADVTQPDQVALAVAGAEVVISAFRPDVASNELIQAVLDAYQAILAGLMRAGIPRLMLIGHTGCLFNEQGRQIVEDQDFPIEAREEALAASRVIQHLEQQALLDWSCLCPPLGLPRNHHGERTGRYRLGTDQPLRTADGHATISAADLAVVLADELEFPAHNGQCFTAAW